MKKLIPPVLFLICLILMSLLRWLWPLMIVFAKPYNLLGIAPVLVGFLSGLLGALHFRKSKTNIRPFVEPDTLVTEGPFRYSRNPMYLGLSLVLLGAWILLGAITPLVGVLIFVVTANWWYIPFEERMNQAKFGPAFDAYCQRTRRWI